MEIKKCVNCIYSAYRGMTKSEGMLYCIAHDRLFNLDKPSKQDLLKIKRCKKYVIVNYLAESTLP